MVAGNTLVRDATLEHLPGLLAIYNAVIAKSTAVYTGQPVTLDDRRAWFEARRAQGYPVVDAVDDKGVLGFASFGEWRGAWPGYRHTVEHSVHVRADGRGQGAGRALMETLFPRAVVMDKHVMLGGVLAVSCKTWLRGGRPVQGSRPQIRPLARSGVRAENADATEERAESLKTELNGTD